MKIIKIKKVFKKVTTAMIVVIIFFLNSCGSTSSSDDETGRLISGEIDTTSMSISKSIQSKETSDECVDGICKIMATNQNGETTDGQLRQEGNAWKWQIRLRTGSWRLGFYGSTNELMANLEINGISEFVLDEGDDIEIGKVRFRNRIAFPENDLEGLGEQGFRSSNHFDAVFDPNIFSIVKVKPEDGRTDIAPCRPIKIKLSQSVDENTINENSISITDQDAQIITGLFEYEEEADESGYQTNYQIKFTPTSIYTLGSTITVNILSKTDGLLNTNGEPLDKDYLWSFTVRDFGGTSEVCHDPDKEYKRYREQQRERENNNDNSDNDERGNQNREQHNADK